jgi:hypothetical protein
MFLWKYFLKDIITITPSNGRLPQQVTKVVYASFPLWVLAMLITVAITSHK